MILTQDKGLYVVSKLFFLSLTTISLYCVAESFDSRFVNAQNSNTGTSDSFVGNNSDANNVNQDTLQNQNVSGSSSGSTGSTAENLSVSDSFIGDNSNMNNVNQNTLQNQNIVSFPDRLITPLDSAIYTPPNTENDLGFNMSVGVNTLDAANVTVYFGLIFQPGRTANHKARMANLLKQTELLELEKTEKESQLKLLQLQIEEAEIRLQGLR